ncbi:twin BRCT domain containing protein [Nitzschia inconspicua]|uniref:Twin BRCT domain containing protein n=1 Tax=Nitzschia inconspicua TaxID=303405 RepID=A0A9K3KZX2_9STRA|nr:twin BRCT domain containing protein [Nitzschia inconspicua]
MAPTKSDAINDEGSASLLLLSTLSSSSSSQGGRKRQREDTEKHRPLQDVVACLSGFPHEQKDELHQLIESLGGRYTRELNLDKNTHLITELSHGAKYELAAANPQTIHIVTPSWLHTAAKSEQRPFEADHSISSRTAKSFSSLLQLPSKQQTRSALVPRLDCALRLSHENQVQRRSLFQPHHFYLLGFEGGNYNNENLKLQLSKLIRRANGTIYWELNEDVTVLVLCDGCDPTLYKAAQIVSQHHANLPSAVSPLWIVESYESNKLQSTRLYPPVQSLLPEPPDKTLSKKSIKAIVSSSTASNSNVFRGCLFSFLKTKIENDDTKSSSCKVLDFDVQEQAAFVKAHGGQLLSSKLVEALKGDAQTRQDAATAKQRKCYVVCWGGGNPRVSTSPLVSQLQRDNLCDVLLVTPFWLQTCVTVRKRVPPERVPMILMPQTWSMKFVNSKSERIDEKLGHQKRLEVSLTGFQGTEKAAIIHVIGAIGGLYHDHMSSTNTHLICKEKASGIKLEKAVEWGLHVVSVQWLYHILEHGYGGAENDPHGCEKKFLVVDAAAKT